MEYRRQHERHAAVVRVSYQSAGAMRADYVQNISRGGLFVATDEPFTIGDTLELHLAAPGARDPIAVPVEVRWVGARGEPPVHGIGVRFDLTDPVIRARIEGMVNAVHEPVAADVSDGRLRVLLVDPNRHAAKMFAEGLEAMARRTFDLAEFFDIAIAHDGVTALELLRDRPFSLVIVELQTPEIDGIELIRRARTEVSQSLPVFAISRPFPGDRHEALAAGADAFVHKPIQLRALFNTVNVMLNLQGNGASGTAEA